MAVVPVNDKIINSEFTKDYYKVLNRFDEDKSIVPTTNYESVCMNICRIFGCAKLTPTGS